MVPALLVTASACSQDTATTFARMLERAASWSASVTFAEELTQQGYLPHTYLHDLLSTASQELETLAQQIEKETDVGVEARSNAADACRQLTSQLRDADRAGTVPDAAALRRLELRLRTAAKAARQTS